MKKIDIEDKLKIKQLLYTGAVLGVKNDRFRSFGGFQLWWYDRPHDVCYCCESHWTDFRKKIRDYSLNTAAKILWRNRNRLFVRRKHLPEDQKLMTMGHFHSLRQ